MCVCAICYIIQLTHSSSCTKWTSFCRISSSTLRTQREEENIHHQYHLRRHLYSWFPACFVPALDVEVLPQHQVFEGGVPGERWDDSQQVSIQTCTRHDTTHTTTHNTHTRGVQVAITALLPSTELFVKTLGRKQAWNSELIFNTKRQDMNWNIELKQSLF